MLLPLLFAAAITRPPDIPEQIVEPTPGEVALSAEDEELARKVHELKSYHLLTKDDAAGDRTFWAPTADTLAKEQYTLSWYPPVFFGVSYGFTDDVSLSYRGTPPNPWANVSLLDLKMRVRKDAAFLVAIDPYAGLAFCACIDGAGGEAILGTALEATYVWADTSITAIAGGGANLSLRGHAFGSLAVWQRLFSSLAVGLEATPAYPGFAAAVLTGGMRLYSRSVSLDVFGGRDALSDGGYGYFTATVDPTQLQNQLSEWVIDY
jgi:hypothetical protein